MSSGRARDLRLALRRPERYLDVRVAPAAPIGREVGGAVQRERYLDRGFGERRIERERVMAARRLAIEQRAGGVLSGKVGSHLLLEAAWRDQSSCHIRKGGVKFGTDMEVPRGAAYACVCVSQKLT